MKQTRALVEGAILVSLFAVLMMISLYIPLIGTFLLLTLPLPAMIQTIRHGVKPGFFMGLVSLPVTLIAGSLSGLAIAFPVIAAGILMGFHYRKKNLHRRLLQQPLHTWCHWFCCFSLVFSFLG